MGAAQPLSEQDLTTARTELAAGRPFPVWFTTAAVGVAAGGSAKVVSIDEAGEGDFIQVKPAGTRDTMFCSPNELTTTRPPRKKAQRTPQPAAQEASHEAAPEAAQEASQPAAQEASREDSPEVSERAPERSGRPESAPARPAPGQEKGPQKKAGTRSRPAGTRAAARPAEVTLTLSSSSEGEWTAEVMVGKKRAVRPTTVQPGDVATAARALPGAVVEAIESSLEAARQQQIERVERLRAELDAAQRALQDLTG